MTLVPPPPTGEPVRGTPQPVVNPLPTIVTSDPRLLRSVDRVLAVQRPVVLAHIRAIRRARPNATPDEVIRTLERRYLTAVTTGGALVGASSVIPAVGIGTSLALSGVETAGFLEATAMFAQSVTEIHGIAVVDEERARTLVMTMILGEAGTDLVRQLAGQVVGSGPARSKFWGELVTRNLPAAAVGRVADQVKKTFLKRFAVREGASIIGRAIPFGIGAIVGGSGNHILGRRVIASSRLAFGPPPALFPIGLEPGVARERGAERRRLPRIPVPRLRRRAAPAAPSAEETAPTPGADTPESPQ
ncbi:MAG: hypothetical protein JWQ12_10 [Glaciihabitans sp.]|nr:hypothetical protein [Glaciihabitans sp.]